MYQFCKKKINNRSMSLFLGKHSMYFSFDTLENFTLITGSQERAFDALVQGRV